MAASLKPTPLQIAPSTLTEEQLLALSRTYDTAGQPVWVHSLSTQCLYRNSAAEAGPGRGRLATFEIIDHSGRGIAKLTMRLD